MEIDLTPDQTAFVRQAIESGRLHRPEEAVREALALWEERERRRVEILAAVDAAKASRRAGRGRIITEDSMRRLAGEVKRRGRVRPPPSSSRRPVNGAPPCRRDDGELGRRRDEELGPGLRSFPVAN